MLSYCTNYLATVPDITVYINCDTRLAINLRAFNLGEQDEFIFTIKNYDYIDSPYVFLFRAKYEDIDENGEVIFKIPPRSSKLLKPGAFYNFSMLANAFDPKQETEYKKLTDNGNILLAYGAQDLMIEPEVKDCHFDFVGIRLELQDVISSVQPDYSKCAVTGVRLELINEVSSIKPSEVVGMRLESLSLF